MLLKYIRYSTLVAFSAATVSSLNTFQLPMLIKLWPVSVLAQQSLKPTKREADRWLKQGNEQLDAQQGSAALQSFQKALKIYQDLHDRAGEGQVLHGIGRAYEVKKDYSQALSYQQKALASAKEVKDTDLQCKALNSLGNVYRLSIPPDINKAIDFFQQSLQIAQAYHHPKRELAALRGLGWANFALYGLEKGLPFLQQEITKAKEVSQLDVSKALRNLGFTYYLSYQYSQASQTYKKALAIAQQIPNHTEIGEALFKLGNFHFDPHQGQDIKALEYYQQALDEFRKDKNSRVKVAETLLGIGDTYYSLGQSQQILKVLPQALAIAKEVEDTNLIIDVLASLGRAYQNTERLQESVNYYEQGLAYARQQNDLPRQKEFLYGLAISYSSLGQHDKFKEIWQKMETLPSYAETTNQQIPSRNTLKIPETAFVVFNRGVGYANEKKDVQAEETYQQAFTLAEKTGNFFVQVNSSLFLGMLYDQRKNYAKAIEAYQRTQSLAQKYGYRSAEYSASSTLQIIHLQLNQYPQSIAVGQRAAAIAEEIQRSQDIGFTQSRLGQTYVMWGKLNEAVAPLRKAIRVFESSRVGLTDLNKVSLFDIQSLTSQVYNNLQYALVATGNAEEALEVAERGRARAFAELMASRIQGIPKISAPSLNQIRQIARTQKATLVEYSIIAEFDKPGPGKLYIWVVQPNGTVTFRRLDFRDTWENNQPSGESFRDLIVHAVDVHSETKLLDSGRELNLRLNKLHKILIQPIADLLPTDPNQQVIFLPQKDLFRVPFPALQDNKGTYLVEQHTIRTAPSIQTLALTHQQQQRIQGKGEGAVVAGLPRQALIIGNPTPMPEDWQPLEGAEQEAQDVAKLLRSNAIIGAPATETAIVKQMPNARLIHLATHGIADDEKPLEESYVVLAPSKTDDGKLTAGEVIDKLKLKAELVVLSACQTGRGKTTSDGIIGLSRAFIAAGTPSIIVSLWDVNDESTKVLMTEFYQNLERNPDRAQALRKAMLTTMVKYSKPIDWAAFTLIGEAQ
jgi:CHAT domain-containing protein/tetratricopeptide (TPR) repeat protein